MSIKIDLTANTVHPQFVLRAVARRMFDDPSYLMEPTLRAASEEQQAYFDSRGRGRWKRLSKATLARRTRAGQRSGTPIGVQTGTLRASLEYGHPDNKVVKLHDQAWYAYPNPRVRWKGKDGGTKDAGLAFLFAARRRIWPPTRGKFEERIQGVAQELFARKLREVVGHAS